ncbi:hypothetical protein BCR42DRAFT_436321 [Absidia repens]|uniref:Uncharacterized protein n=1 Tax=Absidia repens TaxID=90262 RepID=A0A1X2IMJ9_9FUNG|nr:hypothetical protein BCR42DRAFT_436321 [Absidia repens]
MIASMDDDDRTKMKKIDLIQQATTRLRRKQLEEQLSDMMTGLTNIQTQSKYLYGQLSGAMATTQQLTDYDLEQQHEQMDLLENQAKLHQAILQQWFPFMSSSTMDCDIPMDINDDSSIVSNSNSNNESDLSVDQLASANLPIWIANAM